MAGLSCGGASYRIKGAFSTVPGASRLLHLSYFARFLSARGDRSIEGVRPSRFLSTRVLYFICPFVLWGHRLNPPLNHMNNSISTARPTLKLKAGARKPTPITTAARPPVSPSDKKAKQKPGAQWSDEYKARMQAEMDVLATR
jgi:hypothetical protein